jgi:hypothetical protein
VYSESRARVEWIGTDADHVRIVHGGHDELSSPQALERSLADQVISWHERFGHRIVYLGGAYHTAVAAERAMAAIPAEPAASAGSLLRGALGRRYLGRVDVPVGLTFGSGTIPQPVPPPAPGTPEAELHALGHRTVLVPLGQLPDPPPRAQGPDRVRIVGPGYDAKDDAHHAMVGDPPAGSISWCTSGLAPPSPFSPDPPSAARPDQGK